MKPRVTHIGELKKQFLPFRETNVLGSFLRVIIFFLLRYFLHSAVCKCDLCQLTETGRYFEVNWTVYWRKLDYSWRKLVGLLMVTRRIIDGNCTFSWRKQGGLFTETGWSGYGNWMVYWRKLHGLLMERVVNWWKQSSRFSSFWGPEKAILPSSETLGFVNT